MNKSITHCPACNGWIHQHSPECPHCHTQFGAADLRRIANPMGEYLLRVYLVMFGTAILGGFAYALLGGLL